jgi:flagellar biosynthesis protein FlhB
MFQRLNIRQLTRAIYFTTRTGRGIQRPLYVAVAAELLRLWQEALCQ